MSSKRVKSLAAGDDDLYDDDDYDEEYGDEPEITTEDREQLRKGTIKVREALGSAYIVPEKDIHDALWNYYYDIGKTVSYLKNKHKPAPSKLPAAITTPKKDVKSKQQSTSKAVSSQAEIVNGVANVTIQDTPRVKSKNIDVIAEYNKTKRKNAANFVVIGHVDAGKSTLMGRLLYDLKQISSRTLDKYRTEAATLNKASFALAWILDQGTEERERGVTIDIATNTFSTASTDFTILDAPGHRDFVPNMIAGASQADFAVLVVDASTGNFEAGLRGQTKEHALLVRAIGVTTIIVAINKMDAASWSQPRFDAIKSETTSFLTAAGFSTSHITHVPCSGLEGTNILLPPSSSTLPKSSWYSGPTLVTALDNAATPSASNSTTEPASLLTRPLRLPLTDVYRSNVLAPLSISGRITQGTLQVGDTLLILPSAFPCAIKSIEFDAPANSNNTATTPNTNDDHDDDTPTNWAVASQNVTLHLSLPASTDLDSIDVKPGDIACRLDQPPPIPCVEKFTAKILAFEFLVPGMVDVHRGRMHVAGRVSRLVETMERGKEGRVLKRRPKVVGEGGWARVEIVVGEGEGDGGKGEGKGGRGLPLEKGERVVLRAGGVTVAAGVVE